MTGTKLLFYFQQCDAFPGIAQSPWWLVVLAMLWSLQWEYLANILYALIIRRLSTWQKITFPRNIYIIFTASTLSI